MDRRRTRNRHVQPSFAPGTIERTEAHRDFTGLVGAVADTQNDNIAFITLDIFEVLYEERVFPILIEEALRGRLFLRSSSNSSRIRSC